MGVKVEAMTDNQKTKAKRRALIRKWENKPSPNPDFKGATPKDVVRMLRGRPPKPVK